MSQTRPVDLQG